jgi:membrane associated rhomboid family serine protease
MLRKNLHTTVLAVSIPWLVYFVDSFLPVDLRVYGIQPRNTEGLWGIFFCPFLHANSGHLIANSGALFVLVFIALTFSRKLTFIALLIIAVLGGGMVWVFGDPGTIHIGSSGIVFGLIGFLMFIGFFRREWKDLAISMAICLIYGGALVSLFYYIPGISWTSHFFGFSAGVLAAWMTKTRRTVRKSCGAKR